MHYAWDNDAYDDDGEDDGGGDGHDDVDDDEAQDWDKVSYLARARLCWFINKYKNAMRRSHARSDVHCSCTTEKVCFAALQKLEGSARAVPIFKEAPI